MCSKKHRVFPHTCMGKINGEYSHVVIARVILKDGFVSSEHDREVIDRHDRMQAYEAAWYNETE